MGKLEAGGVDVMICLETSLSLNQALWGGRSILLLTLTPTQGRPRGRAFLVLGEEQGGYGCYSSEL